jgi:hypothetical protein
MAAKALPCTLPSQSLAVVTFVLSSKASPEASLCRSKKLQALDPLRSYERYLSDRTGLRVPGADYDYGSSALGP